MVLFDVLVNCSIHRRGIRGNTRPRLCKLRSKRFWGAWVCGHSYRLSLISLSSSTMSPEPESHQCKEREGTRHHPCKARSITDRQCINSGTRGGKLTKIQNTLWSPIWAQASLLTTRQMALTVNHRGVPMPASTQGQPAAAPATSPQGQLVAYRLARIGIQYRLALAFLDAQSTAHVRA